ncbi:MAG: KH domain-containing protein [Candidatus Anstonellaceae archaeon]
MRTPICKGCAFSEKLCKTCAKKLTDGEISPLEVEIAKILYKINENYNISASEFSKAYEIEGVVIVESSTPGLLIGKKGKVISLISSALQKKVRIIRNTPNIKEKISDIVFPIKFIGINTYFKNGEEKAKLILEKKAGQTLYLEEETLKKILTKWLKREVEIIYQ